MSIFCFGGSGGFIGPDGEKGGGASGNDQGQQNDPETGRNLIQQRQPGKYKAGSHGDENNSGNDPVGLGRRNNDGDKHTVKSHAEGAQYPARQDASGEYAEKSAEGPTRGCNRDDAIIVKGVQFSFFTTAHAENFIRISIGDKKTMEKRCSLFKLLGQGTGHETIAQIDDKLGECHFHIAGRGGDDTETGKLSCRGQICQR